jgi:MarR family transcriptional regulator, transcriptional regulator for hemolysin
VRYPDLVTQTAPGGLPVGFEDDLGWLFAQCFRAHVDAVEHAVAGLPHGVRGLQALSGAVNCSAHNQAELARQLGIDRTVMVYLVDDLVKAGLVERITDPADRRSKLVRATPEGARRLTEVKDAIAAADSMILSPLSPDDQRRLREMLRMIAARHLAADGDGDPCRLVVRASETG